MPETLIVGIGEHITAAAPYRLASYGIGSCAGIAIYDASRRMGALAHSLLPDSGNALLPEQSAKYTDTAIELMLAQLIESGCDRGALVAKLAGGATMFDALYRVGQPGIGERNIETARTVLARHAIPVVAEDVGGTIGRSMFLDLESGVVTIRSLASHDTRI